MEQANHWWSLYAGTGCDRLSHEICTFDAMQGFILKWTVFYLGFYITVFEHGVGYKWQPSLLRRKIVWREIPAASWPFLRFPDSWQLPAHGPAVCGWKTRMCWGFWSYETWVQNINSGCTCTKKKPLNVFYIKRHIFMVFSYKFK